MAKSTSKFKDLCDMYRFRHGRLSIDALAKELSEKYDVKYTQPLLSGLENRKEGPPLEMVERYANFFNLKNKERFDFYLAALEASEKTEKLDFSEIDPFFWICFVNFLHLSFQIRMWALY